MVAGIGLIRDPNELVFGRWRGFEKQRSGFAVICRVYIPA
jgi:hypothetical protein